MSDTDHSYLGLWVTDDGYVRQQLLPGGRYREARGTTDVAYTGDYQITGDHIEYQDDSGFHVDGDFVDGVLHHAGMRLTRVEQTAPPAAPTSQPAQ